MPPKQPDKLSQKASSSVPRLLGKNFAFFRKYYFSQYNSFPDAPLHQEMVAALQAITANRGVQFALAAPRGSAKSTVVTLQYAVYCIVYALEPHIIITSTTQEQAEGCLKHIQDELTSNRRLLQDFPDVCETGAKPGPPRWKKGEIITRNDVKVTALGCGQQIRGRRHKQFRPSLIILDDIEGADEAKTAESYEKLHDWLTKSVLKVGDTTTNVIFVGTIHHYGSLLAQFTDSNTNAGWLKKIYRSVIHWADNQELWEEWRNIYNNRIPYGGQEGPPAAEVFFKEHEAAMLAGAEVLWPERYPYYALMKMRENDGVVSFDSEMQNDPVNPRDCLFNLEELRFWDDAYKTEEELLRALGESPSTFGACDPSLGKQNKHSDYSAIISAVREQKSGIIYVLDADIERRHPDKTIEAILACHNRRHYQKFGFETNQFQEFMASELTKRSAQAANYLPLKEVDHRTDKRARIEALQPLVKNGTIRFSRRHHRLLEQMKYYPKGAHDDGLDALEMVVQLAKGHCTIFDVL